MDMITVSVASLKQKLSSYLRAVEAGEEVIVTSHRRRVARLAGDMGQEPLARPPSRPVQDVLPLLAAMPAKGGPDVVELLLEDRKRR